MTTDNRYDLNTEELRQKLNLETGQLTWPELQRYFARGMVIIINPDLDLVEVAARFAENDKESVKKWTDCGLITRALDNDAIRWQETESLFWAVVITPWVLVQEITK